jgi:hypothetical protein
MGLDSVEFVMAVERAFDIDIPDAAARTMVTPGDMVDYLQTRVTKDRAAIENVVQELMAEELGISKFNWTDRFVKDLGVN